MGGTLDYTIGSVGHEQTLQVAHANNDVVQVKLKTLAIERANTIAIFDASSNGFTGHYQEKERTTVFQLYLNTDTIFEGTPFVEGPNAIVIPTSLFTKTELHGYIEHDRLDETPLYSDEEGKYEFYSVDRDGNKLEDACGDCDFHIVRFDLSAEEAMEILDLLLNCLIDAETNETAVLYSYISTKDDGISATMMNLPSAAMLFIPLDSPHVSAELGAAPRPFDPLAWWLGVLVVILYIITFGIAYLIITIASSIADITNQNNQNAQSIGMTILSWLAHLAWLLVRAAILIFAWIVFALLFLFVNLIIITMMGLVLLFDIFASIDYSLSINNITVSGDLNFDIGYTIDMCHIEFFKIDIPILNFYFTSNEISFELSCTLLTNNIGVPNHLENPLEQIFTDNTNPENSLYSESKVKASSTSDDLFIWNLVLDYLIAVGSGIGLACSFMCIISGILEMCKSEVTYKTILTILSILAFIATILLAVVIISNDDPTTRAVKFMGLGYGIFIAGLFAFIMSGYIDTTYTFMANIIKLFFGRGNYDHGRFVIMLVELLDIIGVGSMLGVDWFEQLNWIDLANNLPAKVIVAIASGVFAVISMILLATSIVLFGGHKKGKATNYGNVIGGSLWGFNGDKKSIIAFVFGLISMGIGISLITIGYTILIEESN